MPTMGESGEGMDSTEQVDAELVQEDLNIYKALVKGGRVKRWHTVDTVNTQNVADHTYGVIATLWYITGGDVSKQLMLAALQHDMPEHVTGDAPHPHKLVCPDEYNQIENVALRTLPSIGVELTPDEQELLKIADLLEMGVWSTHELSMGNAHAVKIIHNVLRALSGRVMNRNTMNLTINLQDIAKKAGAFDNVQPIV